MFRLRQFKDWEKRRCNECGNCIVIRDYNATKIPTITTYYFCFIDKMTFTPRYRTKEKYCSHFLNRKKIIIFQANQEWIFENIESEFAKKLKKELNEIEKNE